MPNYYLQESYSDIRHARDMDMSNTLRSVFGSCSFLPKKHRNHDLIRSGNCFLLRPQQLRGILLAIGRGTLVAVLAGMMQQLRQGGALPILHLAFP